MRVMVLIAATASSEAGEMPTEELLTAMGAFNEDLANAGVLLAGEGLKPTSVGVRMTIDGDERIVEPGPFPLNERPVAGFWLWEVSSMEEAVSWLRRCPLPMPGRAEIQVRPLFEASDFGDEFTPDLREQEERLRRQLLQE